MGNGTISKTGIYITMVIMTEEDGVGVMWSHGNFDTAK
jgi:hypothetical protein